MSIPNAPCTKRAQISLQGLDGYLNHAVPMMGKTQKIILAHPHPPKPSTDFDQLIEEIYRLVKTHFLTLDIPSLKMLESIRTKMFTRYCWISEGLKQNQHSLPAQSATSLNYLKLIDDTLTSYIHLHEYLASAKHRLQQDAQKSGQSIYLPKQVTGWIRPLQITPDGHVFIHYNSLKSGDPSLGNGGNKKVKFAYDLTTHAYYASASTLHVPYGEIFFLNQFKGHPGFVQLVDTALYSKNNNPKFRMVFELCQERSLLNYLTNIDVLQRKNIFEKLIPLVAYIHEKKFIHRDLTLSNIFLKLNKNGLLDPVIGDLGAMCHVNDVKQREKNLTSAAILTPELARALTLQSEKEICEATTTSLDDWGLAYILHWLVQMSPPLPWLTQGSDEKTIIHLLSSLKQEWIQEPKEKNSPQHLVWEMLQKRLPAIEAVKRLNSLDWTKW